MQQTFLIARACRQSGQLLLEDIAEMHGVFIMALCKLTRYFDVNGCDAPLHSSQKKRKREAIPRPCALSISFVIGSVHVKRFALID